MQEIATRASWKNIPIDNPKKIFILLLFSEVQFNKLKKGLIPHQMEDKWFIFYEDGWLYFHRSWTGYGFYKAQLINTDAGYLIKEFWVERNHKKYKNTEDKADAEIVRFLIDRGLLCKDISNVFSDKKTHTPTDLAGGWSNFGNLLFSNKGVDYSDSIKSVLFGVAVGDALGVPVEFKSREEIRKNPIIDMIGYGTFHLPPGTFSDDGSLTFCLAEALTHGYDINAIGQNFVKWYQDNYWTPLGNVFDIGIATKQAIIRLANGEQTELVGGFDEYSNGNGSLMRIAPLLFYILYKPAEERWEMTKQVSSITHGHIRSVVACFYYLEFARFLYEQKDKFEIYRELQIVMTFHLSTLSIDPQEIAVFDRLLKEDIHTLPEEEIYSSGYVIHTLEASIWCLLTTNTFEEAVLKAVNLGEDTDTTAAVTGGLAGLLYGYDNIPSHWINQLARKENIEDLAQRLSNKIGN